MKKMFYYLFIVLSFISFFDSCSSIRGIPDTKNEKMVMRSSDNSNSLDQKSEYLEITTSYTLNSLLLPVIQLNNFMKSMDYFNSFLNSNDYIFPDYLFTILEMEKDSYQPGVRTVLTSGSDNTGFQFEKVFLSETDDGNKWWRYRMTSNGNDILIEVLSNPYGVPLKIRFTDPSTGMNYEKIPDIALDFARAEKEAPPKQLADSIEEKIIKDIEDGFSSSFINPEIVGKELVTTPAGKFMTVLVKDSKSKSKTANYWLSPDVPGGIVKISVTDNLGIESYKTELSEITGSSLALIPEDSITLFPPDNTYNSGNNYSEPGYSEGSRDSPILLYAGEDYYGSVSDEGTSYYKIINKKRSDLSIEVSGLEGIAELIYFGTDSQFENRSNSSKGSSLNVEDYMVSPGSIVYFSIHDIADEYSIGEHFTISFDQNPILNPIGIKTKGDIYKNARELNSGKSYVLDVGNEGLDYYKTTIKKGSILSITVLKEPESGKLIWFDTGNESSFSMSTEEKNNGRQITISDLKPGTICYYYFAFDVALLDPLQKLELKITEK